jgi:hypothetical protein
LEVKEGRINERRGKLVGGGGAHLAPGYIQSGEVGQENTISGKIPICYEYYACIMSCSHIINLYYGMDKLLIARKKSGFLRASTRRRCFGPMWNFGTM